jgi:pilus assembly protein CpaB
MLSAGSGAYGREKAAGSRTASERAVAGTAGGVARGRRRLRVVRGLRRLSGWPRRVAAMAFAMAAVLLMLRPDPPAPVAAAEATVPVVVVARDLPAGATVDRGAVRTVALPASAVPGGTARDMRTVVGRVVAGPVRRGEPLTDARLLGPGLTAGLDGTESTAAPVRLADPDSASLVRPGDRVDVLGTPVQPDGGSSGGDAITLATAVRVLAVLRGNDAADGVLLVVAVSPAVSRRLAGAAAGHRLTVAVRPP